MLKNVNQNILFILILKIYDLIQFPFPFSYLLIKGDHSKVYIRIFENTIVHDTNCKSADVSFMSNTLFKIRHL